MTTLASSTDFIAFTERIKRDHQIAISPSANFGRRDEAVFKFRCQRSHIDHLTMARDELEEYLDQHNVSCWETEWPWLIVQVQVRPPGTHKRADSFADAFHHFNSRLLSTKAVAAAKQGKFC